MAREVQTAVRIRVYRHEDVALGPGRSDILRLIGETGSIAEAARQMNMSYRRAWALVQSMNSAFKSPLVERITGGAGGGGARLTKTGEAVLEAYLEAEAAALRAAARPLRRITRRLK